MKQFVLHIFLLCSACLFMVACEKDTEPTALPPTTLTLKASDVKRMEAFLAGTVTPNPNSVVKVDYQVVFLYSSTSRGLKESVDTVSAVKGEGNEYSLTLKELKPGTVYYYCISANSGFNSVNGEILNFKTLSTEEPAIAVRLDGKTEKSIALTGNVIENGGADILSRGFVYKVYVAGDSEPTINDGTNVPGDAAADGSFSAELTENIKPETTYIIRAYATNNDKKTGYSEAITVQTNQLQVPTVMSGEASDLTAYTARLHGTLLSDNGFPVITRGFCYSAESQLPTLDHPCIEASLDGKAFEAVASGLESTKTYYFRAYAKNEKGTGYGEVMQFTLPTIQSLTLVAPTVGEVSTESARVVSAVNIPDGSTVVAKGVCYSNSVMQPSINEMHIVDISAGTAIDLKLEELTEGTTYYIRAYAQSRDDIYYSSSVEFRTTQTTQATIGNVNVADIQTDGATLSAVITDNGGATVTGKGFCYSKNTQMPTIDNSIVSDESEGSGINAVLNKLEEGVTYYVRAYATNKNGTGYSNSVEFQTVKTTQATVGNVNVTDIQTNSATLGAVITDNGKAAITGKGFCYSKNTQVPTIDNSIVPDASEGNGISAVLEGLEEGATYYVRAYATNKNGTGYSNTTTFSTVRHNPPTVSGLISVQVNDDNVTVQAQIDTDGGVAIDECGFCWSDTSSEPTILRNPKVTVDGVKQGTFKAVLTGLAYNTDYYIRAYAINGKGTGYSAFIKIHTKSSGTPVVQAIQVTNPTPSTLDVSATLSSDGGAEILEQGFCYGTNDAPTIEGKKVIVPVGQSLKATLQGLIGYTRYYVRAYATNKNGTTYSGTATGTTKKTDPDIDDPAFPGTK